MPTKLVRPVERFGMVEGKTSAALRFVESHPLAPFVVRGTVEGKTSAAVQLVEHWRVVQSSRDQSVVFVSLSKDDVQEGVRTPSEIIDARLRAFLGLVPGGSGSSRVLLVVDGVDQGGESTWEQLNERRLSLIEKDIEQGLSAAEKAELDELEKKAEDYMDANAPVSFEMIDRLKECAARDGLAIKLD